MTSSEIRRVLISACSLKMGLSGDPLAYLNLGE